MFIGLAAGDPPHIEPGRFVLVAFRVFAMGDGHYPRSRRFGKAFPNFAGGTFRFSILRERSLELRKSFPSVTLPPCATFV